MKSLRIHSYDSRNKTLKSHYSVAQRDTSFYEKPTPLDFDSFIPWFCLELQLPKNVVVTRTNQAEYVRSDSKSSKRNSGKSLKSRSTKMKLAPSALHNDIDGKKSSALPKVSFATSTIDITDAIPVTTCYDKRGRLVEVSIVGCPFQIPRKVIQAFNLCLPFHPGLFKLSIQNGGLCQIILHEISKLLPHSNITEICLDDSRVPGGSFSILLHSPSQIKYLSLKRCSINDEECKKIAATLDLKGSAKKSLLALDLTSNNIMDGGAQALGETLKSNRHLIHLNLSGNSITDAGASFVFQYLTEFLLTFDDIKEARRRRLDYLISRSITYKKCLEEVKRTRFECETKNDINVNNDQINQMINIPQQIQRKKMEKQAVPSFIVEKTTVEEDAETKTTEILGEFEDPFAEQYIRRQGDLAYAIGNLTLTSLNLAYNNLSLLSVRKILEILKCQSQNKLFSNTGLLRIVIDGNNIPTHCDELYEIDLYLKRALVKRDHSFNLIRTPSHYQT